MIPLTGGLLSLGLADRAEFAALREQLAEWSRGAAWPAWPTVSAFLEQRTREPIVFAVVWQSWPDEFSAADVHRLLAALPLCRVVCVTGAWCESDARTRRVWPPALVVPWWRAGPRLAREWQALCHNPGDLLPWTASREETWLWEQASLQSPRLDGVRVSIAMSDPAFAATIRDVATSAGATVVEERPDVVLVDADPWSAALAATLADVVTRVAPATVVAFSAWTTPELLAACRESGVAAVLPKLDPSAGLAGLAKPVRDQSAGRCRAGT